MLEQSLFSPRLQTDLYFFFCLFRLLEVLFSYFVRFLFMCAHCFPFASFLLTATTTLPTPVSEITTLTSQSNTSSSAHPAASSSLSSEIESTTKVSEQRIVESLSVVPLRANKTISSNDKDDSLTVTSSTQSPTTVNLPETKIKPESEGTAKQFVNNDSNKQANQPQTELLAGGEIDEKSRSNPEKEGRAIIFPSSGVSSNNQSSTLPAHMRSSVNYVTTSTEKAHVMSFFDLSDVSMDHYENEHPEKMTTTKTITTTTTTTEKQDLNNESCSHNGSTFKASIIDID